ncbi:hypothetical protein [Shinella zoogloeoides]|uniref:hypothetical protein n=1 Tax=Shinella zoogloeoides TaxID=352475 RepID=UPI001F57ED89|nr:hypothetical protein [Shinella zoogloeoides]
MSSDPIIRGLLRQAADFIADERENIFCAHSVNGELMIEDEADQRAANIIAEYDAWLVAAKAILTPSNPKDVDHG